MAYHFAPSLSLRRRCPAVAALFINVSSVPGSDIGLSLPGTEDRQALKLHFIFALKWYETSVYRYIRVNEHEHCPDVIT